MMMSGVNYVIYDCFYGRKTPGVLQYWSLTLEENIIAIITQYRVIDGNVKRQIKNRNLCACRSYKPKYFNILVIVHIHS